MQFALYMHIPLTIKEIEESLDATPNAAAQGNGFCFNHQEWVASLAADRPLLESSLVYWMLTQWHMQSARFSLETDSPANELRVLQTIAENVFGKTLTLLPHGKVDGISRSSAAHFRNQLFKTQEQWPDLVSGNSASLICIDAYPEGLAPQLYSSQEPPALKAREHFDVLIDTLFSVVTQEGGMSKQVLAKRTQIATIIYELFKNTHEHARTWIDGEYFSSSCRGIYARYYAFERLRLGESEFNDRPNQADAFARKLLREYSTNRKNNVELSRAEGIIEFSVFDSGPGMAQRWLGRNVTDIKTQEQYDSVLKCLNKGQSSDPSPARGYGLWKVLRNLKELRGFIRIRTNQIHVARDFLSWPTYGLVHSEGMADAPKEVLFDWDLTLTSKVHANAPVRGTVASIMLPVNKS